MRKLIIRSIQCYAPLNDFTKCKRIYPYNRRTFDTHEIITSVEKKPSVMYYKVDTGNSVVIMDKLIMPQ